MKKQWFQRLPPLILAMILSVVLLQPFSVVSAAEDSTIIKAGTYRFNEELSNYPDIGAGVYTYNLPVSGMGYQEGSGSYSFVGSAIEINMISGSNNHNFVTLSVKVESTSPDYSPFVQYPYIHQVFAYDVWKVPTPVVFTVLEDTEVADEFGTWFYANVKELKQISGKWRWNDVLSTPTQYVEQELSYSFSTAIPSYQIEVTCNCNKMTAYPNADTGLLGVLYTVISSVPDMSAMGYQFPMDLPFVASGNIVTGFGEGIKTIDYGTTSQYVSAEFYEWFTANAVCLDLQEGGKTDMGIVESITSVWTAVATWFISTMGLVPSLFYVEETGLTFIGTLAIFGGGLTVIIGIIYAVRSWLKSR